MKKRRFLYLALGAFALLSAADFALTRHLLENSGSTYEANPVANWLLQRHGWSGLAAFKVAVGLLVAVVVATIYFYRPRAAQRLLAFGCSALAIVVLYSGALAVAHPAGLTPDAEVV